MMREAIAWIMAWKYSKFAIAGAVGTACSAAILYTMTEWLGLWYMASFIGGTVVGSIVNYQINKRWVWKENFKKVKT